MKHKTDTTALPREDASEDFKAGTTEHTREEAKAEPKREEPVKPHDEATKEIADHEKWMADHTDDARGVQERLQKIAVLQAKLAELDAPKPETRMRQTQTV